MGVSQVDHMKAKVGTLYQKLENLIVVSSAPEPIAYVAPTIPMVPYWEVCGLNGHSVGDCQMILIRGSNHDIVKYVNKQRGNPYSNTYNPWWRDHPNFSYKKNHTQNIVGPYGFPQGATPRKSNLDTMMESFMATQTRQNDYSETKTSIQMRYLGSCHKY